MELKTFLFGSLLILSLAANAIATDNLGASVYGSLTFGSKTSPPPPTYYSSPKTTPSPPPPTYYSSPKNTPSRPPHSPPPPASKPSSPPPHSPPPPASKPSSTPPHSPPPPASKPSSPPPSPYYSPTPKTPKPSPPPHSTPPPSPKPSPSPPPPTNYYSPAKPKHEKPKKSRGGDDHNKHSSLKLGVEGLIMCKDGSKVIPIEGAVARITCLAINVLGFEVAPFSCRSHPTDKKGYFFASFSREELLGVLKIVECKAFLESSPLKTCKVPLDINNGISGCPLNSFKMLPHNHLKLYSVKPLYFGHHL